MATKKGMIDAVKQLLDRGADVNRRDQVNIQKLNFTVIKSISSGN